MSDVFILCVCLFYGFLFYRVHWVSKERSKLRQTMSDDDFCQNYYKYWDYGKMYRSFWIWDIEKMKCV